MRKRGILSLLAGLFVVGGIFADLNVTNLSGFGGRSTLITGGGGGMDSETVAWIAAVDAAGGTYEVDSKSIADALIVALKTKAYESHVIYILPLLGSNLAAARVPLRDSLAVGIATNHSFVDGDFSQATGLQGNGSTKYLDSLIKPAQLGTSANAGLGFWENNFPGSPSQTDAMGCYDNSGLNRLTIDLRPTVQIFFWGAGATNANQSATGVNADYFGQRSSATSRKIFVNGSLITTNSASDTPTGLSDRNILIVAGDESGTINYWPGRCAVAYMTDGTLSDADAADFHTLLSTYLITPTGR